LVAAEKKLAAATKILFVVPNFVADTEPFFSVRRSVACNQQSKYPRYRRNIFKSEKFIVSYGKYIDVVLDSLLDETTVDGSEPYCSTTSTFFSGKNNAGFKEAL